MISDESVERTLDWLHETADAAAKARANRTYLEEYRKSLKALLMAKHKDKPIGAQEREAYADPEYIAHLEVIRAAVEEDERFRWQYVAAQAKFDAWRSFQATARTAGRLG